MKNNEELFINITPGEAPDLDLELSSEEKAQLTAKVLAKIEAKQQKNSPSPKIIKFHRRFVSVAAAAVLLVVSTTAIATITNGGFKLQKINMNENQQVTELKNNDKETEVASVPKPLDEFAGDKVKPIGDNENKQKYVYLKYKNLDGYSVTDCGDGWYNFENDVETLSFDCQVIYGDIEWSRDYIVEAGIKNSKNIVPPTYQWKYVKDRKALYVKYKKDWMYSQQLFVRYKDSKYSLNILTPSTITKSELMEFGKNITLEICSQNQASDYVNLSDYLEKYSPEEMKGQIPMKEAIDYSNVAYPKDTVTDSKVQITLESVENQENISNLIKQTSESTSQQSEAVGRFYEHIGLNANLFTNDDGTLSEYTRSYVYVGDGINTPKQKIVYQSIQQKFYRVKLRVKNISQQKISDLSLLYPLRYVRDEDDYYYDTDVYSRPVGINSCQINNQPKYFSPSKETLTLEPGQEQVVELGYFVDADLSDNIFMVVLGSQFDLR